MLYWNKKVLLRERKRHTAPRVVTTRPPPPRIDPPPGWTDPPPGWTDPPTWTDPPPQLDWPTPWMDWPPPLDWPPSPLWTDRLMDGWKDRCVSKHYLPVVLRTRAVIRKIVYHELEIESVTTYLSAIKQRCKNEKQENILLTQFLLQLDALGTLPCV